jgi:hypothetical protein
MYTNAYQTKKKSNKQQIKRYSLANTAIPKRKIKNNHCTWHACNYLNKQLEPSTTFDLRKMSSLGQLKALVRHESRKTRISESFKNPSPKSEFGRFKTARTIERREEKKTNSSAR